MVRNDTYTEYAGKEYRIGKHTSEWANLISYDSDDVQLGFEHFHSTPDMYRKQMPINEIGDVYSINTYGIYQGREFHISEERNSEYLLETDNEAIAEEHVFERVDKYGYEKWVNKSEISRIFEDKKIITNYFDR